MRIKNWQDEFWKFMEENRQRPFEWGTHDCVIFAKRCVELITARQILIEYKWNDEVSAKEILDSHGGLSSIVSLELGEATHIGNCSQADIVLAHAPIYGDMLCVHDGVQLIGPGETCLRKVSFAFAKCGWRID